MDYILHSKCLGCLRILEKKCSVYYNPTYWWEKRGGCPLATHTGRKIIQTEDKTRIGQQKQKKKSKNK